MLNLPADSFIASPVLVRLLYHNLASRIHVQAQIQMAEFTRDQLSQGFDHSLTRIRNYESCRDCAAVFWLVDEDCNVRKEFLDEVKRCVTLHHSAEFDDDAFKLRFGEEISHWALMNQAAASKRNLIWIKPDGKHCLSLVRKIKEIDSMGCA